LVDLLIAAAVEADVGIENGHYGCLVAFSDDLRRMRKFAIALMERAKSSRSVRLRRTALVEGKPDAAADADQLDFFQRKTALRR